MLSAALAQSSDLITMRGLKPDAAMWVALQTLLVGFRKAVVVSLARHPRHVTARAYPAGDSRAQDTALTRCSAFTSPLFHVEHRR